MINYKKLKNKIKRCIIYYKGISLIMSESLGSNPVLNNLLFNNSTNPIERNGRNTTNSAADTIMEIIDQNAGSHTVTPSTMSSMAQTSSQPAISATLASLLSPSATSSVSNSRSATSTVADSKTEEKKTPLKNNSSDNKELTMEEIEKMRKSNTVPGLSGLANQGNTCYMNAALQALNNTIWFSGYFLKTETNPKTKEEEYTYTQYLRSNVLNQLANKKRQDEHKKDDEGVSVKGSEAVEAYRSTLTYQLAKLFREMYTSNKTIRPRTLKDTIGDLNPIFRGFSQNDSQELINFILDHVHEELKVKVKLNYQNISPEILAMAEYVDQRNKLMKDENVTIEIKEKIKGELKALQQKNFPNWLLFQSIAFWRDHIRDGYSIVKQLFTGVSLSTVTCHECKQQSTSFEPFNMLPLSIPDVVLNANNRMNPTITLEELLQKFSTPELLSGNNKYECEKCKLEQQKNNKALSRTEATKILHVWITPDVLIIPLKRFKMEGRTTTKNSTTVTFPLENLDIKSTYSQYYGEKCTYDLIAVVEHLGGYGSGHYISHCKNPINKKWYKYNDDNVYHVPSTEIVNEITGNAYVLFYQKNITQDATS